MRRIISPIAEAILEEYDYTVHSITYQYKLKKTQEWTTAVYICQGDIVVHLGNQRTAEEYAEQLYEPGYD